MTSSFRLTSKQEQANELLGGAARDIMLYGGSRSGKTFLECRAICVRGLLASNSRHAIFRFRYNSCRTYVLKDTWPKMLRLCFPAVNARILDHDGVCILPNKSEIWFGGLDDKERTEKLLGGEYATIMLNECSQIPWASHQFVMTRLAQKAMIDKGPRAGETLALKAYYDENPPDKGHWSYKVFFLGIDPETKRALPNLKQYAVMQMNPEDNSGNISSEYLDQLRGLGARMQKRFLKGEFRDANPNALFPDSSIDQWRVMDGHVPQLARVVVAVDPSGAGDEDASDHDAIGVVVCGLGTDGNAYVLEDCTVSAGPAAWGKVAVSAFERHEADVIVGETNFGGAMVRHVIQTARARTPYKEVKASRGKVARADPIASLCEQGKIRFVGYFPDLEDELAGFTTGGYVGARSPNRADAFIWGMSELFPAMVTPKIDRSAFVNRMSRNTGISFPSVHG